jgi:hypothetical protein
LAKAVREEQIRQLERLWYAQDDDQSPFAGQLAGLIDALGEVYEVDELAARWMFTGREKLTVAEALETKARLEQIEELLRQIEEAHKNAKVALIDMDALSEYLEPGEGDELNLLRRQIQEAVERLAAEQGLQKTGRGYELTPQALRIFQGKLLEKIFADLDPSRTGRHQGDVKGEGAVETVPTRPFEFGDACLELRVVLVQRQLPLVEVQLQARQQQLEGRGHELAREGLGDFATAAYPVSEFDFQPRAFELAVFDHVVEVADHDQQRDTRHDEQSDQKWCHR